MIAPPRLRMAAGLLLFALLAGSLAFLGAQRYLERATTDVESRWRSRFAPSNVLVAQRDLQAGDIVTADDLARRDMPTAFIPSGTLLADDSAMALGQRLLHPMKAGDPFTRALIQSDEQASLAARLRDGNRAVTVPVDEVSSQAGLVRPGDRVDLLLAEERVEGAERCVVVRSLLESLPVLATGQMQQPAGPDSGPAIDRRDHSYSTITLDVTPEQAGQLAVGLRVGELIPMLRGQDDRAPVGLQAMGTERTGCRTAESPGPQPVVAQGSRLEMMVGGRDSVERTRVWLPEG